jgi:hypothetical protein
VMKHTLVLSMTSEKELASGGRLRRGDDLC